MFKVTITIRSWAMNSKHDEHQCMPCRIVVMTRVHQCNRMYENVGDSRTSQNVTHRYLVHYQLGKHLALWVSLRLEEITSWGRKGIF
jgi:hypothetical protein